MVGIVHFEPIFPKYKTTIILLLGHDPNTLQLYRKLNSNPEKWQNKAISMVMI